MKNILYLVIILINFFSYSQNLELENSVLKAENAINDEDYQKAITIYKELTNEYRFNSDFLFNLANLYFIVKDNDNACECLYKAATLNDIEANEIIENKCQTYKNGKVKLLQHVDTIPQFLYLGTYYDLIENNSINSIYIEAIKYHMNGKTYLTAYNYKNIEIDVKIDDQGSFIGKVYGLEVDNNENALVKKGLEEILKNKIKYKPAIFNENQVEIFENYTINLL